MLARRMLALLAIELAGYAWLAAALAAVGVPATVIALAIVAIHVVLLRTPTVLLGFGIAAVVGGRPGPRLGWIERATLVVRECRAFWLNYALVPIEPLLPPERPVGRVVLVHGILCNRAVWWGFRRRLEARGIHAHAVTLEPVLGEIDAMADHLAAQLRDAPGPVVLVGHSLGGLVIRRLLQRSPELRVAGAITIASPHEGSVQAALAFGRAGASLRRGSPWLRSLAATPPPTGLPRVAIGTWHDELVSPPDACRWDGAETVMYRGVGHIDLLWRDDVADRVAREIRRMLA